MLKTPIIGYRIMLSDIISGAMGLFERNSKENYGELLSLLINEKQVYLTNSGISAFYIVLEALKKISSRREVVLPAYSAGSLVVAIKKAGLKPVLCDISLHDFSLSKESLRSVITADTLCVVCVHLFGIPMSNIKTLKDELPREVFLIEDCAQSMGSKIDGVLTGNYGDASIFSFNRGKNYPMYSGGAILMNANGLSDEVENILSRISDTGLCEEFLLFLKFIAMSVIFRPIFYTLLSPLMGIFKEDTPPADFSVAHYTRIQAQLGAALLKGLDESSNKRYENAVTIINGLKTETGLILPRIGDTIKPAFNRFPVLVKDQAKKERIEKALRKSGIEVSRMYKCPLHHMFDLDYEEDNFRNASYLADHLLTLPVHSMLRNNDISKIINLIKMTA